MAKHTRYIMKDQAEVTRNDRRAPHSGCVKGYNPQRPHRGGTCTVGVSITCNGNGCSTTVSGSCTK